MSGVDKEWGDRERLAQLVEARANDLRRSWTDIAAKGEITAQTIRVVRKERGPLARLTLLGLDVGLDWELGSAQAVLEGGYPTPLGSHTTAARTSSDPVIDAINDSPRLERWMRNALIQHYLSLVGDSQGLRDLTEESPPRPAAERKGRDQRVSRRPTRTSTKPAGTS